MDNKNELLELIKKLKTMVPESSNDYCQGFDFALMHFEKFALGQDPFSLDLNHMKVSLKQE